MYKRVGSNRIGQRPRHPEQSQEFRIGKIIREFGERMENAGIKGKRIRYRAVCVHLDHKRGYATKESIERNRAIRAETRRTRSVWAAEGLAR